MNLGGTEKSFLNLLEELPKDYEIDLLLLEKRGALLPEIPPNINVIEIDNNLFLNEFLKIGNRQFALNELKRGHFFSFLKNMVVFLLHKLGIVTHPFWGISHYLKSQRKAYDHAVAYAGIHNFISYYTLKSITAKKKMLWIHFDVNKVIGDERFGQKFYPLFNKIVCVSENAKISFINMFPTTKRSTVVFRNKVSKTAIQQKAAQGDGFSDSFTGMRIVTLGRLSKEKGQHMIPEVVSRLKNEGFTFRWYLIGDGNLRTVIEKSIANLKIEDQIILLGSKLNPYPYLNDCDLYVQTSLHEGYCITLHEAKVFGKPVVTTNFLSASNLIKHEEDGLIVEISEDGIYEGVKRLLSNENLRQQFSKSILVKDTSSNEMGKLFKTN